MKKWIRFLTNVGEHKKDGFLEVDEKTARAYVDAGLAVEDADGPTSFILKQAQEEYRTSVRELTRGVAEEIRAATAGLARPGESRIQAGESEAEKRASIGDYVRCIYFADSRYEPNTPYKDGAEERHKAARERLANFYHKRSTSALSGNAMATGGALTPMAYEAMLLKVAPEDVVFAREAHVVPMTERGTVYPALDQYQTPAAGQSAFFGGVQVFRKTEQAQRAATQPGFKDIQLNAKDLTALCPIPRDLLEDSALPIDSLVTELIGGAIAWREDWECLQGSGVGQMLGIYNAASTIFVSRTTGGTIKYQDIFTMYSRLWSGSAGSAVWYAAPYTIPTLLQIQDPSGKFILLPYTAAGPDAPLGARPKWMLLGIPLILTEKVPGVGSTGDLTLTDRKKYLLGRRGGTEMSVSDQFYFDTDRIALRAKLRNDGQPEAIKAITLADGTSQVSTTVVLQ